MDFYNIFLLAAVFSYAIDTTQGRGPLPPSPNEATDEFMPVLPPTDNVVKSTRCEGTCKTNRGYIEFNSKTDAQRQYKSWTLESEEATSFLLHLTNIKEERNVHGTGLNIAFYYKSDEDSDVFSWTSPQKLLRKNKEILYLPNTKKVWIFWLGLTGEDIQFNINYYLGCGWAYGKSLLVTKEFGSSDRCWIIVPRSDETEQVTVVNEENTFQSERYLDAKSTVAALTYWSMGDRVNISVSNMATGETEKVTAGDEEDTLSRSFHKTSYIEVNHVKFGTVLFVDMECKDARDCETSRFTLSSTALSAQDESCILKEMDCRFNANLHPDCPEIITAPTRSSEVEEFLPMESMMLSECSVYTDIVTQTLGLSAPLTHEHFVEGGRSAFLQRGKCNGKAVKMYCSGGYSCARAVGVCKRVCMIVKMFYCSAGSKFRLF